MDLQDRRPVGLLLGQDFLELETLHGLREGGDAPGQFLEEFGIVRELDQRADLAFLAVEAPDQLNPLLKPAFLPQKAFRPRAVFPEIRRLCLDVDLFELGLQAVLVKDASGSALCVPLPRETAPVSLPMK
jgi:hypothetical protein